MDVFSCMAHDMYASVKKQISTVGTVGNEANVARTKVTNRQNVCR